MNDRDYDIESYLAYSEKLYGQAIGHQQETAQLLREIAQLQHHLRRLLDRENRLLEQCEQKDSRIRELEQRVSDLQKNTQYVYGDYIGQQRIEQQILTCTPVKPLRQEQPDPVHPANTIHK